MTILTFDHLINKTLFNSIKTEFLMGDIKYKDLRLRGDSSDVDLRDNEITTFQERVISTSKVKSKSFDPQLNEEFEDEVDVYDTEVEEVTLNFVNDFLIPQINELPESYSKSFVKEINRRNLFSNSQIANFSKIALRKLEEKKDEILAATHLENSVKDVAIKSIDEIYEFVSNDYYQNYISIPKKIPFNLNRNQVVGLFHLLYENEYISPDIKQNDLFRLIEETCFYFDFKSNSHKDLSGTNKLRRSLFGLNPDKSSKSTIDELQKIFQDKDFF
ncbi:MAG: hypothetical protein ACJA2S_003321 [Cyclobacteriaceae bacterium]|jgi:hypothetical protein